MLSTLPNCRGADGWLTGCGDRGLSQIVSVILLIAVAVVLIGGVAGFMFGLFGDLGGGAPKAQYSFSWDNDAAAGAGELTVSMTGGPSISDANAQELQVVNQASDLKYLWGDASQTNFDVDGADAAVTAGDAVTKEGIDGPDAGSAVNTTAESFDPGETIKIVWVGPNNQQTQTLATYQIPS